MLKGIREHMVGRDTQGAMGGLGLESIFSEENVARAIAELKRGTVPGRDGLDSRFYARGEIKKMVVPVLCELFRRIAETQRYTRYTRNGRDAHRGRRTRCTKK